MLIIPNTTNHINNYNNNYNNNARPNHPDTHPGGLLGLQRNMTSKGDFENQLTLLWRLLLSLWWIVFIWLWLAIIILVPNGLVYDLWGKRTFSKTHVQIHWKTQYVWQIPFPQTTHKITTNIKHQNQQMFGDNSETHCSQKAQRNHIQYSKWFIQKTPKQPGTTHT